MLKLRGSTARDVTVRISGELTGSLARSLYVLPWNRFEIERANTWWLAPEPENPAYPHGKFIFTNDRHDCDEGSIQCGLHVEKGFEQGASGEDQILTSTWTWHRFVASLKSGEFGVAVEAASAAYGALIQIQIETKTIDEQESLTAWVANEKLLEPVLKLNPLVKAMAPMKSCSTLRGLGAQLETSIRAATQWFWIDFYVLAAFKMVRSGSDDALRCADMLGHLEPWVAKAQK